MKLTNAKSQILGVSLSELTIDLIHGDRPPLIAKFMLLRKDGTPVGSMSKGTDHRSIWSEKVLKAMNDFVAALEDDVLPELFEIEPSSENVNSGSAGGLGEGEIGQL